jgi:hypothetical protein
MAGSVFVVIGRRGGFHIRTLPQPAKQVKTRLRTLRNQTRKPEVRGVFTSVLVADISQLLTIKEPHPVGRGFVCILFLNTLRGL